MQKGIKKKETSTQIKFLDKAEMNGRNWGYYWNTGGSSADPCAETYMGEFISILLHHQRSVYAASLRSMLLRRDLSLSQIFSVLYLAAFSLGSESNILYCVWFY